MTQRPRPKGCNWFLTSASFSKSFDKNSEQTMLISPKTVAFSNKNFTASISGSSPRKSEIEHTLREDVKHQGNEFDVNPSSKNKENPYTRINKQVNEQK
jgi:hypothetical protein